MPRDRPTTGDDASTRSFHSASPSSQSFPVSPVKLFRHCLATRGSAGRQWETVFTELGWGLIDPTKGMCWRDATARPGCCGQTNIRPGLSGTIGDMFGSVTSPDSCCSATTEEDGFTDGVVSDMRLRAWMRHLLMAVVASLFGEPSATQAVSWFESKATYQRHSTSRTSYNRMSWHWWALQELCSSRIMPDLTQPVSLWPTSTIRTSLLCPGHH